MKVLFLDIDGVCNSRAYLEQLRRKDPAATLWNAIDPAAAELVKGIFERTGAVLVLSSTWRMYSASKAFVAASIGEIYDCTPDLQMGRKWGYLPRGAEILEWLDLHPDVTKYAILDDNTDFFADQYLFKTEFDTGLTPEIAEKVVRFLNKMEVN